MKSDKLRRAEIKAHRLERAARAVAQQRMHVDVRPAGGPGLVVADTTLLAAHNNTYGPLPSFYVDKAFTCRDCGAKEVWTAKQQKWWYEIALGNINSAAVRCRACRLARRALSQAGRTDEDKKDALGVRP
jgi:hypothetical protein